MANKSSAVLARMEPELKEQAEAILNQLGIPASVVITCLYKQIVYTRGVPFPLVLPPVSVNFDDMSEQDFNEMLSLGVAEAEAGYGIPLKEAFSDIKARRNAKKI